jgi:hypothetical protein
MKLWSSLISKRNALWVTSGSCICYLRKSSSLINALVLSSSISHSDDLLLICNEIWLAILHSIKLVRKNTLGINCTVNRLMIHIIIVDMWVYRNGICILFRHFETLVQEWIIINFLLQCKLFQKLSSCTSGST